MGEEEEGEDQSWPRAKRRRSDDVLGEGESPLPPQPPHTPRVPPLPSWWHPPLLLPAQTKQEVVETEEEEGESKEAGVTPPLMSPGLVSPFPPGLPQPPGVVDPRQLLHLLARKVRQLFAHIPSPGKTMLLIKLSILFLQKILGKYFVCQSLSYFLFSAFIYCRRRQAGAHFVRNFILFIIILNLLFSVK